MIDRDGILCPICGSMRIKVYDSRPGDECVERRRECLACTARFSTKESVYKILRIEKGDTPQRGRPSNFPSPKHEAILGALSGGPRNKAQISNLTGVSKTQTIRLVDQLAEEGLISCARAGDIVSSPDHPLTIIVELSTRGAEFLAKSKPSVNCASEAQ